MIYYMGRIVDKSFDDALWALQEKLHEAQLGILTEIDVTGIIREKLGREMKRYRILGVCDPELAYRALQAESKIGTLLPCNVIVQETGDEKTEVASVDPVSSMMSVKNPDVKDIASQMQTKLRVVIESL